MLIFLVNPGRDIFFPFLLSCAHKLLTRFNNIKRLIMSYAQVICFNNIITRLNNLICRSNKLCILFKQDNNSFKKLLMSYEQTIYLVLTR